MFLQFLRLGLKYFVFVLYLSIVLTVWESPQVLSVLSVLKSFEDPFGS